VDSTQDKATLTACQKAQLTPSCFYEPKHQIIYLACLKVAEEGALPDELTLTNNLRTTLQLDVAGGVSYIRELSGRLFSPSPNVTKAVSIIKDKLQARQLIYLARELSAQAQSGAFTPAELAASVQAKTQQGLLDYLSKATGFWLKVSVVQEDVTFADGTTRTISKVTKFAPAVNTAPAAEAPPF